MALLAGACFAICAPAVAQDSEWTPVTGAETLCYQLERNAADESLYRVRAVAGAAGPSASERGLGALGYWIVTGRQDTATESL